MAVKTVAVGMTALTATLATALLVGGSPTVPPVGIQTPVADAEIPPGYVAQVVRWQPSEGATGYRIYLDSAIMGNVPGKWVAATLSLSCGVRHKINVQPFNNKGLGKLAAPLYVIPPCPTP